VLNGIEGSDGKKKKAFRKGLGNGRTERSKGDDILYDCHHENITTL
jgi:hypothetical protein